MSWVGFIYCIESGLSISFLDVQVSSCFITTIICHLAFVSDRFKAVLLHEITLKLTATVLNIQNLLQILYYSPFDQHYIHSACAAKL